MRPYLKDLEIKIVSFQFQDFVCELITPGDVTNYDKIQVHASGFCPVALVTGQGFVLPGKLHTFDNAQLTYALKDPGSYFYRDVM